MKDRGKRGFKGDRDGRCVSGSRGGNRIYPRWVETLAAAVGQRSETEKRKLFRDNAVGFYRLDAS